LNLKNWKNWKKSIMRQSHPLFRKFFAALILLCLCSCVGVKADIVLNSDNTGTIQLEYRISKMLESLGKMDGNEKWLPVPVGRADFERSLQRMPGIRMLSFSTGEDGGDILVSTKLQFSSMEALLLFLNGASGEKALYARERTNPPNRLAMNLGRASSGENAELEELFLNVSKGYSVSISLSLPAEGSLTSTEVPGARTTVAGRKLSCSLPLGAILYPKEPVNLEFRW
jgi:hypothetical protein